MPNQHTKRKERIAAAAAKKATGAYKKTQDNIKADTLGAETGEPKPQILAIKLSDIFKSQFPKMETAFEKAETQPHFTLMANNNFTPVLIRMWIDMAMDNGTPIDKIREAKLLLKNIEDWRRENPLACKIPD